MSKHYFQPEFNFSVVFFLSILLTTVTAVSGQTRNEQDDVGEFCTLKLINKHTEDCPVDMSYIPWPMDETCKKYSVRLGDENSWKPRALLVLPWSGRGGLGQMIEQSTGNYIGYIQPHWVRNGSHDGVKKGTTCVLRRPWNGRTIVQKTNHFFEDMTPGWVNRKRTFSGKDISMSELSTILFDYRGIVVIRNPWDVLHEYRYLTRRGARICCSKTLPPPGTEARGFGRQAEEMDWDENEFGKYMVTAAANWVNTLKTWIKETPNPSNLLVIRYEKLMENPMAELSRALNYLNVTVEEERLECVRKYPPVRTFSLPAEVTRTAQKLVSSSEKANRILSDGISQINALFRQRGIDEELSFSPSVI